jgi:hypothetical protein
MKVMRMTVLLVLAASLVLSGTAFAQESTTFNVIITKVRLAARYLQENGEAGLAAFNDPNGAWVWADTYIFVYDCDKMICVAHPVDKWIGADISTLTDIRGKSFPFDLCRVSTQPKGGFVEYWFADITDGEERRKVSYALDVPGQPYQVVAGIYEPTLSIGELYEMLEKTSVEESW